MQVLEEFTCVVQVIHAFIVASYDKQQRALHQENADMTKTLCTKLRAEEILQTCEAATMSLTKDGGQEANP